jgi:hypothetical protein
MTHAAFTGYYVVSRYFFGFEIDFDQLATALLTVNKHRAPLLLHGRTPIVSVVSYLILFSRAAMGSVNKIGKKHAQVISKQGPSVNPAAFMCYAGYQTSLPCDCNILVARVFGKRHE